MTLYNSIGQGYNQTRQSDPRIVDKLIDLLDLPVGKTIADIGAGTGNYSNAIADRGYKVVAIEPSVTMKNQAQPHQDVTWVTAAAESIPLDDNTVDGAIVMLALHHFENIATGIKEIDRIVAKGNIVIFAFEQNKIADFWLTDYFPYFIEDTQQRDSVSRGFLGTSRAQKTFPSTKAIANQINQITQKQVEILPFLLPPDLIDNFAAAGWCQPELYLNDAVRNGISTFSKMPIDLLETGINNLTADLDRGVWLEKYGQIKQQHSYDAGYRILIAKC